MMRWTIISGTNRPESNTRKVSHYFKTELEKRVAKDDQVSILDLQKLPESIFRPQSYSEKPSEFAAFQDEISRSDGIISVLPEYNGSAPGVFKYFIDMLAFPESFFKKPVGFVGLSAGRFGAVRSVEQMQQVFLYRNAFLYPESVFIKEVGSLLESDGTPKDAFVLKLSGLMLEGFVNFAKKLKA